MLSHEEHGLIRDIYTIDYSVESSEMLLDRMVHLLGARHAILGYANLISGHHWDVSSTALRHWQQNRVEEWMRHSTEFRDIYERSAQRAGERGLEELHSPAELFTEPTEQQRSVEWLKDVKGLLGYSSYLGGAFASGASEVGFIGVGFSDGQTEHLTRVQTGQSYWLSHLAGASALHQRIRRMGAADMVLDRMKWGVILRDPMGRVVYVNRAAEELLSRQPSLSIHAGQVRAPDRLLRGFDACRGAGTPPSSRRNHVDILGAEPEQVDCVVFATSFTDPDKALSDQAEGTLIFLCDPAERRGDAIDVAAQLYHLTEAERACLDLVIQGYSRKAVAEIREVSPETVKTQIAQIMQKLACSRQSEIVARVAMLDPPFTGG